MFSSNLAPNILDKVQALKKSLSREPQQDLYARMLYSYQNKIILTLQDIVQSDDNALLFDKLSNFLSENWQMVKGSLLCYTSLAQEPITQLLCTIATELALSPQAKNCSPVELLMPGVECESINRHYPNLDTLSLGEVLNRYIIGRNGNYLIPIQQVIDEDMGKGLNFYFSLMYSQDYVTLQQEELDRLVNHSTYSQKYAQAYKDYQDYNRDNPSLLTQLKQLTLNLYFNSKYGIGTEEQAGSRAYKALIDFCAYYEDLEAHEKNIIPELLHNRIKQLINVASKREPYPPEMKCIGTQRELLDEQIKNYSHEVDHIGLSDENKKNKLEQKKQALERACKVFIAALERNEPLGEDKLGLSKRLLNDLAITDYSVSSSKDLELLMQSNPEEILLLCEDPSHQEALLQQFTSLESLVFFLERYPLKKCQILFEMIGLQLSKKLFTEAQQFLLFLNYLDDEKFNLVLSLVLKNEFFNKDHVMLIQHILTPEKKRIFFNTIPQYLIKILPTWNDIKQFIKTITTDELLLLYPGIKEYLFHLMQEYSCQNTKLDYFLELSTEKQEILVELINKDFDWMLLLDKAEKFQSLLSPLIRTERSKIFALTQGNIKDLIHTTEDLLAIMSVLDPDEKTLVLKNEQEHLSKIIQEKKNINQLFRILTSDQKILLIDALEAENFINLVNSTREYKIIRAYVSEKKRACFEAAVGVYSNFQAGFFKSEPPAACGQVVKKLHLLHFNQKNLFKPSA